MRFGSILEIIADSGTKSVPSFYRKGINSLIKESIQKEDYNFFFRYYKSEKKNLQKPFTFSVFIPDVKLEGKKLTFTSDSIKFNFSTNDLEFFIKIYNGLLKVKEYPFFDYRIRVGHTFYNNPVVIKEDKKIFQTLSPVLLRDFEDRNRSYLLPDDPKYINQMKFSIRSIVRRFLNIEKFEMEINIRKFETVFFFHYNEIIKGADMVFELKAPSEILQLVYDIGLGSRRSEGFGMVEITG